MPLDINGYNETFKAFVNFTDGLRLLDLFAAWHEGLSSKPTATKSITSCNSLQKVQTRL